MSSFRLRVGGHARRAAAYGAHTRGCVSALHRDLRLRDNAALTCVPLTQARIAAINIYYGPADTCEARAHDACARLWDTRARGDLLAVPLGDGRARFSSYASHLRAFVIGWRICAHECVRVNEAHAKITTRQGYTPASPAPWIVRFGDCTFSGDYNGAPLECSGSCPSQSGELVLNNKGITSVKNDSFAGMRACG